MILIAIAIILLCKPPTSLPAPPRSHHLIPPRSTPPRRLLLLLAPHPQHLPHLALLPTLPAHLRPLPSRPGRHDRHRQHRRPRPPPSPRRLLRHLHQPGRWRLPVLEQCVQSGQPGERGPGPAEPDLGRQHLQGQYRLPLPDVKPPPQPLDSPCG